jgi:hypothetical protein
MSDWRDFKYSGFWDQPRTFYTLDGEQSFLFDCQFDEQLDDYPESYNVYLIPRPDPSNLPALWIELEQKKLRLLGTVKIPFSAFDPSRRKQVDLDILKQLVPAQDTRDAP